MDKEALRLELFRNGHTYKSISSRLEISENAFWRKINGFNDFTLPEIQLLAKELKLNEGDLVDIFFND